MVLDDTVGRFESTERVGGRRSEKLMGVFFSKKISDLNFKTCVNKKFFDV